MCNSQLDAISEDASNINGTGVRDLFADNFSDQADATANDNFESGNDG